MASEYFWKKTNWDILIVGTTQSIMTGNIFENPCKCFRRKGVDFVRVFDSKNKIERIVQLQENNTLKDGIYRRKENGETKLGCQYFDRTYGNTGEGRIYYLNMTVSGDIQYLERIRINKTNREWKTITKFVYNKETFTWSKVEL